MTLHFYTKIVVHPRFVMIDQNFKVSYFRMDWFNLKGKVQSERIDTVGLNYQGLFIRFVPARFYL